MSVIQWFLIVWGVGMTVWGVLLAVRSDGKRPSGRQIRTAADVAADLEALRRWEDYRRAYFKRTNPAHGWKREGF